VIVLVMGVCGTGKSTVGSLVAEALGAAFLEADSFHPRANVEKMARGEPLDDEDRKPWLDALAAALDDAVRGGRDVVIACSALKQAYRDRLLGRHAGTALVVHLHGDPALIAARMGARAGHFMPPSLLPTQLATLEPPRDALAADIARPPSELVADILRAVAARRAEARGATP